MTRYLSTEEHVLRYCIDRIFQLEGAFETYYENIILLNIITENSFDTRTNISFVRRDTCDPAPPNALSVDHPNQSLPINKWVLRK